MSVVEENYDKYREDAMETAYRLNRLDDDIVTSSDLISDVEATEMDVSLTEMPTNTNYSVIEIVKAENEGFGLNIIGGTDDPHFPGETGIFISRLRPDGPAERDGRLRQGDRILRVNDVDLTGRTHDEAVAALRSAGRKARLVVEQGAETRIISLVEPSRPLPFSSQNPQPSTASSTLDYKKNVGVNGAGANYANNGGYANGAGANQMDTPLVSRTEATPTPPPHWSSPTRDEVASSIRNKEKEREEDAESVASLAPSLLDDVPRTPKRPMSLLDPRSGSLITEVLYVSIGLAVIGVGAMLAVRFVRSRR